MICDVCGSEVPTGKWSRMSLGPVSALVGTDEDSLDIDLCFGCLTALRVFCLEFLETKGRRTAKTAVHEPITE
jgi:hypothetical protein